MLSNKAPFGGRTDRDILKNVMTGKYNLSFLDNCSQITINLIKKLLNK